LFINKHRYFMYFIFIIFTVESLYNDTYLVSYSVLKEYFSLFDALNV